jgi:hypothetical protein
MSSSTLVKRSFYSLNIPPKTPTTDDHKISPYNNDMEYIVMDDVSSDVEYEMVFDMEII